MGGFDTDGECKGHRVCSPASSPSLSLQEPLLLPRIGFPFQTCSPSKSG